MKLAVIPGDGIGQEVTAEARRVLEVALPGYEATEYDLGARRYNATGEVLPDSVLTKIDGHDAILLGAIGDPSVPPGVLERGLLLKLRFEFDQYVNLRPSRLYPGASTPLAGAPAVFDAANVVADTSRQLRQASKRNVETMAAARRGLPRV